MHLDVLGELLPETVRQVTKGQLDLLAEVWERNRAANVAIPLNTTEESVVLCLWRVAQSLS